MGTNLTTAPAPPWKLEANGYSSQLWPALRPSLLQPELRRFRRIWERFVVLVNRLGFPNLIAFLMLAQTLGMAAHGKRSVGHLCRRTRALLMPSSASSSSDRDERSSFSSTGRSSSSSSDETKNIRNYSFVSAWISTYHNYINLAITIGKRSNTIIT